MLHEPENSPGRLVHVGLTPEEEEDSFLLFGRFRRRKGPRQSVTLYKWVGLIICAVFLLAAVGAWVGRVANRPRGGKTRKASSYNIGEILKPRYHMTAETGWMNDPNGMMFYNGLVHVFFQLNPYAPRWAAPFWGHIVSRDLAHWQRLKPALAPEAWFDGDGVFSGSGLLDLEGHPRLMCTGVNLTSKGYYQRQGWAVPADLQDAFLTNWTRPKRSNPLPMEPPPGGDPYQFRDPLTPWPVPMRELQPVLFAEAPVASPSPGRAPPRPSLASVFGKNAEGVPESGNATLWMTAVGVQDDCIGAAAMYASPDLENWAYAGTLFSQLSQNLSRFYGCMRRGAEDVPHGARDFGTGANSCDQFGADCHMWECPDFFEISKGIYAFKYSDQVRNRPQFSGDWYVLGDQLNYSVAAVQDGLDAFQAVLGNTRYNPLATDYGAVYASKSFQVGSRRLWLGWVYEDSLPCDGMCGDGTHFTQELGWQGAQTLLRQIEYDPTSQRLRFFPIPETEQLRSGTLFSGRVTWRGTHQKPDKPYLLKLQAPGADLPRQKRIGQPSSDMHRQLEIRATFSVECNGSGGCTALPPNWGYELGMVIRTGDGNYTTVKLQGNVQKPASIDGSVGSTTDLSVFVDKLRSGYPARAVKQGGLVDGPREGHKMNQLVLHVFLDASIVEVYAMDGRARVTSRIYPLDTAAVWEVGLYGVVQDLATQAPFNEAGIAVEVEVYGMDSCWVQNI